MATPPPGFQIKKRYIAYMFLCMVTLYVIVPQIGGLQKSLPLIAHAKQEFAFLALAITLFSYVAAAGVYTQLAVKPLKFGRTVFMQFASMFANRLLPAGIGGIGINYLYLRKQHHSAVQAASVVAANNMMGFIGHFLLTLTLLATTNASLPIGHQSSWKAALVVLAPGLLVLLVVALLPSVRRRLFGFFAGVGAQLLTYHKRPVSLLLALLSSVILTLANIIALQLSCHAVGVQLSLVTTLIIFTFGLSIGTATPTPGSIGGIEVGLAAGLIAYHVAAAPAVGAVLLYRLISYWLPLLLGGLVFVIAKRRQYF
ncbi:MAG: hypothetical protein JWO41_726 [Candidatus Saccharibacteria bacterium]|nr:hypothetical protein [Candidatus Saccharibacteria bacterium]